LKFELRAWRSLFNNYFINNIYDNDIQVMSEFLKCLEIKIMLKFGIAKIK